MQWLQCSIFHNLLRTFATLQVLLDILLLTKGASEDYEIVVKNFFFPSIFLFFLEAVIFTTLLDVYQHCKTRRWNDNVVSTLSNVVHVNVGIHNVDSTLLDVVNFNVEIHNVASTLIWRCPTSRRCINQKIILKQRWNVCWEYTFSKIEF